MKVGLGAWAHKNQFACTCAPNFTERYVCKNIRVYNPLKIFIHGSIHVGRAVVLFYVVDRWVYSHMNMNNICMMLHLHPSRDIGVYIWGDLTKIYAQTKEVWPSSSPYQYHKFLLGDNYSRIYLFIYTVELYISK